MSVIYRLLSHNFVGDVCDFIVGLSYCAGVAASPRRNVSIASPRLIEIYSPIILVLVSLGSSTSRPTGSREIYSLVQPATLALGYDIYTLNARCISHLSRITSRRPNSEALRLTDIGKLRALNRQRRPRFKNLTATKSVTSLSRLCSLSTVRPSTTYVLHHCPSANPLPFACLRHCTLLPILSAAKTATLLRQKSTVDFIPAADRG